MASNIIKVIIDATTDGLDKGITSAKSAFDGFKSKVGEAEGAGGKFKAGLGSIGDTLKSNMGPAALAAGTALVAFGIKSVHAFEDTAKAAIDLGTATGLSTEQASKWIAVGDDFGVSAGDLQTGMGKIAKTMDDTKWADYGIATRDASGEARSANDIFLDSVDMLSKVDNKTEQARIGQELFGKGYQSLTPILGKTREEYEKMLGAVSDGQTITEKEAKKAEKMRLAEDTLKDSLGDVTIAFGELVAEAAPAIAAVAEGVEVLAKGVGEVVDAFDAMGGGGISGAISKFKDLNEEGKNLGVTQAEINKLFRQANGDVEIANASLQALIDTKKQERIETAMAADDTHKYSLEARDEAHAADKAAEAHDGLSKDVRDDRYEHEALAREVRNLKGEYDALLGTIDQKQAWLDLQDAIDGQNQKMMDSTATDREKQQSTLDTQAKLISYLQSLEGVPAQKQTDILALIDQGKWNEANAALDELSKPRTINLNPKIPRSGAYASGTDSAAPGMALVGERGPEYVAMSGGEKVFTAAETARMRQGAGSPGGTTIVNVRMPPGLSPRAVAEALRQYSRYSQ